MTATTVTSPNDIERAIEAYLVTKIEAFKKSARQQNMRFIFTDPAATVSIFEAKFEKIGQLSFRVNCPVHVQLAMTNAKDEESRRDDINPLVLAVMHILSRQRFGLKITDLMPHGFKDVTSEEDWKNNRIVYDLELSTSFTIQIDLPDDDGDLLTLAMQYFLKPGDDLADATDTINLT